MTRSPIELFWTAKKRLTVFLGKIEVKILEICVAVFITILWKVRGAGCEKVSPCPHEQPFVDRITAQLAAKGGRHKK